VISLLNFRNKTPRIKVWSIEANHSHRNKQDDVMNKQSITLAAFVSMGLTFATASVSRADEDSCGGSSYTQVVCSNQDKTVTFVYGSGSPNKQVAAVPATLKFGSRTLAMVGYSAKVESIDVSVNSQGKVVNSLESLTKGQSYDPRTHSLINLARAYDQDTKVFYDAHVAQWVYRGEVTYFPAISAKLLSERVEVENVPYNHTSYKFKIQVAGFKPLFKKLLGKAYSSSYDTDRAFAGGAGPVPASEMVLTCKEIVHDSCP
jgi:hypothetical protein